MAEIVIKYVTLFTRAAICLINRTIQTKFMALNTK